MTATTLKATIERTLCAVVNRVIVLLAIFSTTTAAAGNALPQLGTPVPVVTAGPPVLSLLSLFATRQVTRDNSASLLVGIYVLNRGGLARPVCQRACRASLRGIASGFTRASAPHLNVGDDDGLMSVCWSLDRHGYDLRNHSRRVCSTE